MLENTINQDIKQSMLDKSESKLSAIRLIKSAIQVEKAKSGQELSDEDILKIIQKLINQSTESVVQYTKGDRIDLVDRELFSITVYKTYLPEQLSDEDVMEMIKGYITETGASSVRDMGKVMSLVNKNMLGKTDMKKVGGVVKNMLS